ncbi:uncharacterized protein LOC123308498 [Coccinella septempunctata]|uniref:uncharacterized protein LOC123308498 n=1 Tax=Coccinella septempunctata TaxID=41139 RepID=UPI001D067F08|nr:uncharacterized protein LOC123308498 [Coccinella septempunctata]
MGNFSVLKCILLLCNLLYIQCQLPINQDVEDRITEESLPLILKFLNDDVEAKISYNSGKIRQSLLKGDILEVDITADVTCKFPNEQCNYESADCSGLLFVKPNAIPQVISVDCNPNSPIEEPIALPVKDEYCEGCFVDVNVDGEGVEQLANNVIQHVESEKGKKYILIEVLKVQQQVINGVNFMITVLIGRPPSVCDPLQKCERDTKEDMYCVVKFFQEPGYYAPKNIISNNCTQTQTFIPVMPKYQSNDINKIDSGDGKMDYKGKYPHVKRTELSENDILKEIISQIIPSDEFVSKSTNPGKTIETSSANNLPDESSPSMISSSTFQEVLATEDEPISVGTDTFLNQDKTAYSSVSADTFAKGTSTIDDNQQMALQQTEDNTRVTSESTAFKEEGAILNADNSDMFTRQKRSLVGGKKVIDVSNPNIKEYTGEAVDYLNTKLSKGDSRLKIGKILSATSQVVSGVSYDVKAELVDCSGEENSVENCGTVPKLCDINIWYRPWMNSRIITIKCDGQTYTVDTLQTKNRRKRESLVGGWTKKETDNPKVTEHLGNLLSNLDSQSGMDNKLKIKEIISVSTQVVAGTNWLIKARVSRSDCSKTDNKEAAHCGEDKDSFETLCSFKFWEKLPDENRVRKLDNVEIKCDEPKLNYRSKRDVHLRKIRQILIGGHNPLSTDDPRITKHLEHLLPQLDSLSDKEHKLKIKNIISATSQVVAGTNWNIKAGVLLSDCKKSDDKSSSDCGTNKDSYETICNFKFWERLPDKTGLRKLDNVEINCEDSKLNSRGKREIRDVKAGQNTYDFEPRRDVQVPGGQLNVDENEPEIYEFISESLRHMDLNSPHDNKFKMKAILSSTRQVVSGYLWNIKVAIVLSDCNKNDETDWALCSELPEAEPKICLIKVWNRPWLEQDHRINITCEHQKNGYFFKSKKSLSSGPKMNYELHRAAFEEFEKTYNKQYSSPRERLHRFSIFSENMLKIELLNKHEQGTGIYGPTKFADLSHDEFSKMLGYRPDLRSENEIDFSEANIPNIELPDSFDWREKNVVTKVKDQGSCGSCWAFSVTGNVEGQYAIKNDKLLEFSEQELVDCDTVDQGCNGGLMDNAYRQIEKLGGLEEEKDYPYDARDESCHLNKTLVRVELAGAVNISQDETEMAKWLVKNGPISIAINANAMQFYMGGVSHPWKVLCNPKSLDHGVLIVGYGVHTYPKFKKSLPYWIIKNSWGKSWGEQGYYRVYRGDGTCGVNQTPSSAILK